MNVQIQRMQGTIDAMFQNREKWRESHMRLEVENHTLRAAAIKLIKRLEELSGTVDRSKNIRVDDIIDEYIALKKALGNNQKSNKYVSHHCPNVVDNFGAQVVKVGECCPFCGASAIESTE